MSMPSEKRAKDPTKEVDRDLYFRWLRAKAEADKAKAYAEELGVQLVQSLGSAYAGTIDGIEVVSHRPRDQYRVSELRAAHPDLADQFLVDGPQVLDMAAFARAFPEIAARYQSRALKPVKVKPIV